MASQFNLNATNRENLGKRAAKRYRKDNLVPAEVYGEKDNQSILFIYQPSKVFSNRINICLLYTSQSPRDRQKSTMPGWG